MTADNDAFANAVDCMKQDDSDGAFAALAHFLNGGRTGTCALARHLSLYIGRSIAASPEGALVEPLPPPLGPVNDDDVATALAAIVAGTSNGDERGACEVYHRLDAETAIEVLSALVYLACKLIHDGRGI